MKFFKNMLILLISTTLYAYSVIPSDCHSITLLTANNITNASISNTSSATEISDLSGTPDTNCPAVQYFIITTLPTATQGVLYMADGSSVVTLNQQLTVAEANGLKFDPKAGFIGNAIFTYRVKDSVGTVSSNRGTVTIPVVNSGGHPGGGTIPTADDKRHTNAMSNQWGPTNILNLSGTDSEGNAVSEFQIKSLPTVAQGVLYMADGTTRVTLNQTLTKDEADGLKFDPKAGFVGDALFTYIAIDGNGRKSNPATVTIPVVNSVNGNMVANNDVGHALGGAAPININVLANDRGVPAGAVVRLVGANGVLTNRVVVTGQGIWTVGANNSVTFTPVAPFVGTPTPIQYVIQNGSNGGAISNRATISITGQCVCEPYESSIDTLSTFGLIVMLFFSSLLGLNLVRKEFN